MDSAPTGICGSLDKCGNIHELDQFGSRIEFRMGKSSRYKTLAGSFVTVAWFACEKFVE
jgi:hypothetical protein